jgi:membrane-associated protein
VLAGYFLGGVPLVAEHLELLIGGVVAVSTIPLVASVVVRLARRRRMDTELAELADAAELQDA